MGSTKLGVSKQSITLPREGTCGTVPEGTSYSTDTATFILAQESEAFCQKTKESMVKGTGYLLDKDGVSRKTLN